jgi:acyl-CoA thioester hydrolase
VHDVFGYLAGVRTMDEDNPEPFDCKVAVRWRDLDALGHVNHAVFLTYLEVGRDAFFIRMLGDEPIYVVARLEIDYRAEIGTAQEWVRVRVEAERLGTTSLTTRETLYTSAGEVAAEARVVTVRWDQAGHKSIPFSPDERVSLSAALMTPGT